MITPTQREIEQAKEEVADFLLKRNQSQFSFAPYVVVFVFAIIAGGFLFGLFQIIFIAVISGVAFIVNLRYQKFKDEIKLQVCEQNKWLYDPADYSEKGTKIRAVFGGGFAAGDSHIVQDQMWGEDFYSGEYCFSTGSGKSRRHYVYAFVGVAADLPVEFNLSSQGWQLFGASKELQLESEKFNKMYQFNYDGEKAKMAPHITKILTPAMQVELVALKEKYKSLVILFRKEAIYFLIDSSFFPIKIYSVFQKDLNQSDVEEFKDKFLPFVDFGKKIHQIVEDN